MDPLLRDENEKAAKDGRQKLHSSLALLPVDPDQKDYLYERLLDAQPAQVEVIRDALAPHKDQLLAKLWAVAEQPEPGKESQRLRAAAALAAYDPNSQRWNKSSSKVVQDFVSVNPAFVGIWMEELRPVRANFLASLSIVFHERTAERAAERTVATSILADYAADRPKILADLLLDADEKQYAVLYPKAKDQAECVALLHAQMDKKLHPQWNDLPLRPSWKEPDAELKNQVETVHGVLAERFAWCQTMPLDNFQRVAESLRRSGYRPTRFRPYVRSDRIHAVRSSNRLAKSGHHELLVAAVWTRDNRDWQLVYGLTAEEIRKRNAEYQEKEYQPIDVTGYFSDGQECYTVLWIKSSKRSGEAHLEIGLEDRQLKTKAEALTKQGYRPAMISSLVGANGKTRYAGIWTLSPRRPAPMTVSSRASRPTIPVRTIWGIYKLMCRSPKPRQWRPRRNATNSN